MLRVNFRVLWREATRGKSIYRILMNECLKLWREEIRGTVLDLACGQEPSYWRILDLNDNEKVYLVGIDSNPVVHPTIVADLTHSFHSRMRQRMSPLFRPSFTLSLTRKSFLRK